MTKLPYHPPPPPSWSSLQMYWNEFNFLWYYWRNSKCQTFFDQHSYSLLWSAFSILVIRPPENPLRTLPSSGQCKRYLTVIRPLQRKRFTKVRRSFISQNLLEELGLGLGDNNKNWLLWKLLPWKLQTWKIRDWFWTYSWYILGKVMKYGGFRLGLFKPWIIKIKGLGKFELLFIRQLIKKLLVSQKNVTLWACCAFLVTSV